MSKITTHILDMVAGIPARGVAVRLERTHVDGSATSVGSAETGDDGRTGDLQPNGMRLSAGRYRLIFETGDYWHTRGVSAFFPRVTLEVEIADEGSHYHIPLLMSPFGYTTYRGS